MKIIFLFLSISLLQGQETDSLKAMDMNTLYLNAISLWRRDLPDIEKYSKELLKKARISSNQEELLKAFHIKSLITSGEESNIFADSLLQIAMNLNNDKYKATAYFVKARNFYDSRDYKESLDNYILTNNFLEKTGDSVRLSYLVKDNIGLIQLLIGDNKKAIELYSELLNYYKLRESWENYLYTQFSLGVAYHQDKQYDKSQEYIESGLEFAKERKSEAYYYLLSAYGANQYAYGNYKTAIDSLKVSIKHFKEIGDFTNQSIAYYFIGESYHEMNQLAESKFHLQKLDSIFRSTLNIYPLTRKGWETLIDYSRAENDVGSELYYIKSLLKADSVISDNYKYANQNLINKYEVPQLLKDRDRLLKTYKNRYTRYIIISTITLMFLIAIFIQFRNREYQKIKKYRAIIKEYKIKNEKKYATNTTSISDKVLQKISSGLSGLEDSRFYLDSKTSLSKTAKLLETNSKYLSMYVNKYQDKSFSNYVNDLRVDYIINRLRKDGNFRKYTLEAIANEAGFTSNEHLNRAFQKKVNLSPSYFLLQIQKEIPSNS